MNINTLTTTPLNTVEGMLAAYEATHGHKAKRSVRTKIRKAFAVRNNEAVLESLATGKPVANCFGFDGHYIGNAANFKWVPITGHLAGGKWFQTSKNVPYVRASREGLTG